MIAQVRITVGKDSLEKRVTELNLLKLYFERDKNNLPFCIEILNEFEAEDDIGEINYFLKKRLPKMNQHQIENNSEALQKIEDLQLKKKFILESMERVHQIKMENVNAKLDDGNSAFVIMEIPKMQLIENLRMQLIEIEKEIKELQGKIII
jgi:hypothetical protein